MTSRTKRAKAAILMVLAIPLFNAAYHAVFHKKPSPKNPAVNMTANR